MAKSRTLVGEESRKTWTQKVGEDSSFQDLIDVERSSLKGAFIFLAFVCTLHSGQKARVTRPGARVAKGIDNLSTRFQFVQSPTSWPSQAASMYLMVHFPPIMTAGTGVLPKDKREWSKQRHHRCLCWGRDCPNMEGHGGRDLPIAGLWASQEVRPAWRLLRINHASGFPQS